MDRIKQIQVLWTASLPIHLPTAWAVFRSYWVSANVQIPRRLFDDSVLEASSPCPGPRPPLCFQPPLIERHWPGRPDRARTRGWGVGSRSGAGGSGAFLLLPLRKPAVSGADQYPSSAFLHHICKGNQSKQGLYLLPIAEHLLIYSFIRQIVIEFLLGGRRCVGD